MDVVWCILWIHSLDLYHTSVIAIQHAMSYHIGLCNDQPQLCLALWCNLEVPLAYNGMHATMMEGFVGSFNHQAPISQTWLKFCENLFPSDFDFDDPIRPQCCTCHDSWAVVACAKLWPDQMIIVRRAGLLWSQRDFEWRWSVPLFQCLTVLEFSFILFDLCLLITFFNFIMNYVPIVTFWIFTYHKIWILSIMFCFIWSYWIIYFLACL